MYKNFNSLLISPKNCFTFSKNTFDLTLFYAELSTFYNKVGLDNDIYYAHVFNMDGLISNPYPISGFQISKIDYNSSFFSFFSDNDITFATDMENNKIENNFNSVYKYNILSLYDSILKSYEGYNSYNSIFNNNKIENAEFFIFISKNCINIPQFDLFKEFFFK
jgi:hypothetical protein